MNADLPYSEAYHSGHDDPDLPEESLERFDTPDGDILVQHTVFDGVHPGFKAAEAVFTNPAWRNGYETFVERADTDATRPFSEYMAANEYLIRELDLPTYMVAGRHMLDYLNPDDIHPVHFDLYGEDHYIFLWGDAVDAFDRYEVQSVVDTLRHVAETYTPVVDFNCGLGRLARAMKHHGGTYICSDVNGRCLTRIAMDLHGYTPDERR